MDARTSAIDFKRYNSTWHHNKGNRFIANSKNTPPQQSLDIERMCSMHKLPEEVSSMEITGQGLNHEYTSSNVCKTSSDALPFKRDLDQIDHNNEGNMKYISCRS